jgi:hypothetical protein
MRVVAPNAFIRIVPANAFILIDSPNVWILIIPPNAVIRQGALVVAASIVVVVIDSNSTPVRAVLPVSARRPRRCAPAAAVW